MKILWLCNIMLPQIAEAIGQEKSVVGGWLSGAVEPILEHKDNELLYLFPFTSLTEGKMENFHYISYIENSIYDFDQSLVSYYVNIIKKYKPDVIHVWGTEYAHSLAMALAVKETNLFDRMIISIQGIMYKYAEVYSLGLPSKIIKSQTLRDFIRKDNILKQRRKFEQRAINEIETLKLARNIIGRTQWDREACLSINQELRYFTCNENLRKDFYIAAPWQNDDCVKHSIFCAQGGYPIKGLHFAIQAIGKLKTKYPDIQLRITGSDFLNRSLIHRQKKSYYDTFLRKLILQNNLSNHINFLGTLDAENMIKEYHNANLFLSPSIIENSSNAIGEAMMLGMPIVASNVGGTPSIIDNNVTAYAYQVDDIDMLASKIDFSFSNVETSVELGKNARSVALNRHNRQKNNLDLINIYRCLIEGKII